MPLQVLSEEQEIAAGQEVPADEGEFRRSANEALGLPSGYKFPEEQTGASPVENLRGMREDIESQFPGTDARLPDAEKGLRPDLIDPREEGVNTVDEITTARQRFSMALREGENLKKYMDQEFGPQNYRINETGEVILRDKKGDEFLADSFGLTTQDFVDVAPIAIEGLASAGAIGAVRKIGAGGKFLLSLAGSVGGQSGLGISELLTELGPADAKRAMEIAKRRSPDAAADFALGILGGKALEMFSRKSIDQITPQDVSAAIERLKKAGIDVPVTAGAISGSSTLQRFEAIAQKIPMSAEVFKGMARERELAINRALAAVSPTDEDGAYDIVQFLQKNRDDADLVVASKRRELDSIIQRRLDDAGDSIDPDGAQIDFDTAGLYMTNAKHRALDAFRLEANERFTAIDKMPMGGDKIVAANTIRKNFKEIRDKMELPTEGKGEEERVLKLFTNPEVEQFLNSVENMNDMTLRQARNARRVINDAIKEGSAVPGTTTRHLKQMSHGISDAIDQSAIALKEQAPETADALFRANAYYKNNVDDFLMPGNAEFLVEPGRKGFMTNAQRAQRTLLSNDPEIIKNAMSGLSLTEKRSVARSMFNKILEESRQDFLNPDLPGGNVYDVTKLNNYLGKVPKDLMNTLIGKKNADDLYAVMQAMAVRGGKMEINMANALSSPDTLTQSIRDAAAVQAKFDKEWKDSFLGPFVRGDIEPAQFDPTEFTSRLAKTSKREIDGVMARLADSPEILDKTKREVIQDILNKSTTPAGPDDIVQGAISQGDNFLSGPELNKTIQNIGMGKLSSLIGKEEAQILKDFATVKSQAAQSAASQAGGLIAGGLITLMLSNPMTAIPIVAQYRIMSAILTNKGVVKGLDLIGKRGRTVPDVGSRELGRAVWASQLANNLEREFGDEPALKKEVFEAMRQSTGLQEFEEKPSASKALGLDIEEAQ